MTYVYRGKNRDVLDEEAPAHTVRDVEEIPDARRTTKAVRGTFDPALCGEYRGYRQHTRYNVPKCQPCKDAQAAYSRAYFERVGRPKVAVKSTRKRSTGKNPKNGTGCGTYNGHAAHKRAGTKACDPCLAALREYKRERERARAAGDVGRRPSVFDPARCGDYAGYKQHQRTGVPACMPCRRASAEHTQKHRDQIRQEAA